MNEFKKGDWVKKINGTKDYWCVWSVYEDKIKFSSLGDWHTASKYELVKPPTIAEKMYKEIKR